MQRAIKHYIKKRAGTMGDDLNVDYIIGAFELIKGEVDQVTRAEIKKARVNKLREWRRGEKLNRGHNNKKLGKSRR